VFCFYITKKKRFPGFRSQQSRHQGQDWRRHTVPARHFQRRLQNGGVLDRSPGFHVEQHAGLVRQLAGAFEVEIGIVRHDQTLGGGDGSTFGQQVACGLGQYRVAEQG
jgi:hypothetical protein